MTLNGFGSSEVEYFFIVFSQCCNLQTVPAHSFSNCLCLAANVSSPVQRTTHLVKNGIVAHILPCCDHKEVFDLWKEWSADELLSEKAKSVSNLSIHEFMFL